MEGENLGHLRRHGLPDPPAFLLRRVHDVFRVTLHRRLRPGVTGIAGPGKDLCNGECVGRNLDLWHDLDVQRLGMGDDPRGIGAGIPPTRADATAKDTRQQMPLATLMGPGQFRERGEVQAECLVIGEMPVKAVHFQQGQKVEQAQDRLHAVEMTRAVEMLPAPFEPRRVFDHAAGDLAPMGTEQRCEGYAAVEGTGSVTMAERRTLGPNGQAVGFRWQALVNGDRQRRSVGFMQIQPAARGPVDCPIEGGAGDVEAVRCQNLAGELGGCRLRADQNLGR